MVVRVTLFLYRLATFSGESTVRPEQPQRQISDGAATRVDVNIGQESWLMSITIVYVVCPVRDSCFQSLWQKI